MDDMTQADRLNDAWDALLSDERRTTDPAFARTLLRLHNLDEIPGPAQGFADRLWTDLQGIQPEPRRLDRWHRPQLALVASLAVLLIAAAVIGALQYDDDTPRDPVAIATQPMPTATQEIAGETPTTPGATPTAPATTPTVDPNQTVPTGPTPPAQLGGGPVYETLEQMVNASEIIVVARTTDEVMTTDEGASLRAVTIERTLRGEPLERAFVIDYPDLQESDQFVLFLNRVTFGPDDAYVATAGFGILPIADGVILPPEEGLGSPVHIAYAGQSVETLATDIAAIPAVEPEAEALLEQYGWSPLGKQALWPRALPTGDAFEQERVLTYMPYSWATLLDASQRVGLDFGPLAGQDVQLLVYFVERDPSGPMARPIWAGFLIHGQSVAGAWIVVAEAERPFGLDERDTALEVPATFPTPMPTPTLAVPTSETVNPAQFYRLAETETFTFCWPYCDEEPKTVGLRDAMVAALDRELTIQPLDVRPPPTPSDPNQQSDGSFVWIVFGYLDRGWPAIQFVYDRDVQLLLLPHDAGWVAAPPELVEIMSTIEPPPPPTKSRP